VSRARGLWTYASEFARTRHYDCFDRHDLGPVKAELQFTASAVIKSRRQQPPAADLPLKGA
jgi:hypothetical protein